MPDGQGERMVCMKCKKKTVCCCGVISAYLPVSACFPPNIEGVAFTNDEQLNLSVIGIGGFGVHYKVC